MSPDVITYQTLSEELGYTSRSGLQYHIANGTIPAPQVFGATRYYEQEVADQIKATIIKKTHNEVTRFERIQAIREAAINGTARQDLERWLRNYLGFLTLENSRYYHPEFTAELKALRPEWFRATISAPQQAAFLQMAREGKPRPKKYEDGGQLLLGLMKRNPTFRAEIGAANPSWLESRSGAMASKKSDLLQLARDGEPRPKEGTRLGNVFRNYINPTLRNYDPDFTSEIKALRPDWFKPRVVKGGAADLVLRLAETLGIKVMIVQ